MNKTKIEWVKKPDIRYCADCGCRLGGFSQQVEGRKSDRRVVCGMCADKANGIRDKRGFLCKR